MKLTHKVVGDWKGEPRGARFQTQQLGSGQWRQKMMPQLPDLRALKTTRSSIGELDLLSRLRFTFNVVILLSSKIRRVLSVKKRVNRSRIRTD